MSRSRRPQCSTGRGCRCCGDAGKVRRVRENEAANVDSRELGDPEHAVIDMIMSEREMQDGDS